MVKPLRALAHGCFEDLKTSFALTMSTFPAFYPERLVGRC